MSLAGMLIGHMVGDFLLQNDWMARNKAQNSWICLLHATIWTIMVLAFSDVPLGYFEHDVPTFAVVHIWLLGTHFFIDRFGLARYWMRMMEQEQFRTGPCAPWSTIVVDNTLHLLTIWAAWKYVMG